MGVKSRVTFMEIVEIVSTRRRVSEAWADTVGNGPRVN